MTSAIKAGIPVVLQDSFNAPRKSLTGGACGSNLCRTTNGFLLHLGKGREAKGREEDIIQFELKMRKQSQCVCMYVCMYVMVPVPVTMYT